MQRFRLCYHKHVELQYIGNLDLHKIWERYLRRARVPVAYSHGFHPQPKIQQAAPLPLGFLSRNDLLDVWVDAENFTTEQIQDLLTYAGQPGIEIIAVEVVELFSPALPSLIRSAIYRVTLLDYIDSGEMLARTQGLLACDQILRERRGKMYDLRPLVERLDLLPDSIQTSEIQMQLASREAATGRPDEVLRALGIDAHAARYTRTGLILSS